MRIQTTVDFVLQTVFLPPTCKHWEYTPTVQIKNGTLSGIYNAAYNQDFFLGVPYAASPVGDRRLRRAEPSEPWTGVRAADAYSNWCLGLGLSLPGFSQKGTGPMSEDCLYINIVSPTQTPPDAKLPVMAWIHGGGFLEGSANDARYNGSFLVHNAVDMGTPVLFVSFNYRLGAFGMVAGAVAEAAGASNLYLHDQRRALAWLQENIAAFGGDPARVTIFGESAGAISVGQHLVAYGGRDDGLFSAAILQSGSPCAERIASRPADKDAAFASLLARTNCTAAADPMACLRAAPAESLLGAAAAVYSVDGDILPQVGARELAEGRFLRIPTLMGTNRNEGTTIVSSKPAPPTHSADDFSNMISYMFPYQDYSAAVRRRLWELYEHSAASAGDAGPGTVVSDHGPEVGKAYGAMTLFVGDFLFSFGRRATSRAYAARGVPSYAYFFDAQTANLDPRRYGVAHFQEIPFVFGNSRGVGWEVSPMPAAGPDVSHYERLAETMSRMWISFAVTHSPNNHKLSYINTEWPLYTQEAPLNMVFTLDGVRQQKDTWREEEYEMYSQIRHNPGHHLN